MNKIIYSTRYSDTDEPDNFGRWARIASYNGIRIAWINKFNQVYKEHYSVLLNFPTLNNDAGTEHKMCYSLDEAKEFVDEKWSWFIEKIKNGENYA